MILSNRKPKLGPDYRRVRELQALYDGATVPRLAGVAPRVVVVGAGLAGLVAASLLSRAGCAPQVFEASERLGGRVNTDHGRLFQGLTTELGGELIDTAHADMIALARRFSCTLLDGASREESRLRTAMRFGGQARTEAQAGEALAPFKKQLRADAARLSARIGYASHSPLDRRYDRMSIAEYLDWLGMDGWLNSLLCTAYTTLNGLDAGEQSSINLLRQIDTTPGPDLALFGSSDERWRVAEGLSRVIAGLAAGLQAPPRQGHRLVRLRRVAAGSSVQLDFATAGRTVSVTADAVVLALPFTLLRQVDAKGVFSSKKQQVIRELAYGTNCKLLVELKQPLWRAVGEHGEFYGDGAAQGGWDGSRLRGGDQAVYTFFLGGRRGLEAGRGSAQAQARRMAREMEAVWPGFEAACTGRVERVHWPTNEFSLGSYSTYRPGQHVELAGTEATPESGIYFAGEHCSAAWQGYLQGAASTGRRAAMAILRRAAR